MSKSKVSRYNPVSCFVAGECNLGVILTKASVRWVRNYICKKLSLAKLNATMYCKVYIDFKCTQSNRSLKHSFAFILVTANSILCPILAQLILTI